MNQARLVRCLSVVLALASAGAGSLANAQPLPPTTGARNADDVNRADTFFKRGLKLYADKKWSEAEAVFLSAFALNPTFDVASNLGAAQYQLGKHRDAAEHLAFALRQWPLIGGPGRRQIAQDRLRDCRTHVGVLAIKVNVEHAGVLVDGQPVGIAPLDLEVFVEPGRHTVEARLEGYETAKQELEATAGAAVPVALVMVAKAPLKPAGTAVEAGTGTDAVPRTTAGPEAKLPTETTPPRARAPMTPVLVAGGVTAGAALVAGVTFTLVANSKAGDVATQHDAIVNAGVSAGCTATLSASCQALQSTMRAQATFSNAALWTFVASGALGAGTVIYALAAPRATTTSGLRAAPVIAAGGGGVVVRGEW